MKKSVNIKSILLLTLQERIGILWSPKIKNLQSSFENSNDFHNVLCNWGKPEGHYYIRMNIEELIK